MMATYSTSDQSQILVTYQDGSMSVVPVSLDNADYLRLVTSGIGIAPYIPPAIAADEVRSEANRRKRALVGAASDAELDRAVLDGTREAVRLLRIGETAWTAEQAARATALETFEAAITAIDAAAEALIAQSPIPADFAADQHWPAPL